jgi:hypothetical protein
MARRSRGNDDYSDYSDYSDDRGDGDSDESRDRGGGTSDGSDGYSDEDYSDGGRRGDQRGSGGALEALCKTVRSGIRRSASSDQAKTTPRLSPRANTMTAGMGLRDVFMVSSEQWRCKKRRPVQVLCRGRRLIAGLLNCL